MCIRAGVRGATPTGLCGLVFLHLELLVCYKFLATSAMNGRGDDRTDCKVLNHLLTPSTIYQATSTGIAHFIALCSIVLHRYADTAFLIK